MSKDTAGNAGTCKLNVQVYKYIQVMYVVHKSVLRMYCARLHIVYCVRSFVHHFRPELITIGILIDHSHQSADVTEMHDFKTLPTSDKRK